MAVPSTSSSSASAIKLGFSVFEASFSVDEMCFRRALEALRVCGLDLVGSFNIAGFAHLFLVDLVWRATFHLGGESS